MADVDILPSRGILAAALVDGNGVAINGSQTVLQLAQRGMRSICEVTPLGVAANGATLLQLAQRGIRNFCPVSELGVATDASTADTLRMRGIQPMVPVSALGVALTGSATILTLAQRGLGYFCPLTENGTATTLIDPTPLTLHALTGAFALGGETMETVTGYMMTAQAGGFSVPANSATNLVSPVPSSSFLFKGMSSNGNPGTTRDFDIDIGTAAAGRLVVVGLAVQNNDPTSLVIDPLGTPVPLTPDITLGTASTGGAGSVGLYSAVYAGGGMTKFRMTNAGAFAEVGISVWVASGLASNVKKQVGSGTGGGGLASCNVTPVAASDYLVAMSFYSVGNSTYASSTEAPTSVHNVDTTGPTITGADWMPVVSAHTPFSVNPSGNASSVVAASYA